jgi:hypothetical protein
MLSNFFRRVQAERHPSLAMCSVFIAVGWCPNLAVPNTYRGSPAITMAATERVGLVLCALETSRYPHTVLLQGRAAHLYAPVRLRFRERGSHIIRRYRAPYIGSRSKRPINRRGLRDTGPTCSYAFNDAVSKSARTSRRRQIPLRSSSAAGSLTPLR